MKKIIVLFSLAFYSFAYSGELEKHAIVQLNRIATGEIPHTHIEQFLNEIPPLRRNVVFKEILGKNASLYESLEHRSKYCPCTSEKREQINEATRCFTTGAVIAGATEILPTYISVPLTIITLLVFFERGLAGQARKLQARNIRAARDYLDKNANLYQQQ